MSPKIKVVDKKKKDLWVYSIHDYREWVVRLYIEIYDRFEPYATIYYDVHKDNWGYGKKSPKLNLVDFEEMEKLVRPIVVDYCINEYYKVHSLWNEEKLVSEYYEGKSLKEISNIGIRYYGKHPKYSELPKPVEPSISAKLPEQVIVVERISEEELKKVKHDKYKSEILDKIKQLSQTGKLLDDSSLLNQESLQKVEEGAREIADYLNRARLELLKNE